MNSDNNRKLNPERIAVLGIMEEFGKKLRFISLIWIFNSVLVIFNIIGSRFSQYFLTINNAFYITLIFFIVSVLALIFNLIIIITMIVTIQKIGKHCKMSEYMVEFEHLNWFSMEMKKSLILRLICWFIIWCPVVIISFIRLFSKQLIIYQNVPDLYTLMEIFTVMSYIGVLIRLIAFKFEKDSWKILKEVIDEHPEIFHNSTELSDKVRKMAPRFYLSEIGCILYTGTTTITIGFSVFNYFFLYNVFFSWVLLYLIGPYFYFIIPLVLLFSAINYFNLGKILKNVTND